MSEVIGPERHRFAPESNVYITPLDPYSERVIQFSVLKQMGYPVDLQQFRVEELPEDFISANEREWERDNFPIWVRPLVHGPGFGNYIEDLDVPGDMIRSDDKTLDELINDHPIKLIWDVDCANVTTLEFNIDQFDLDDFTFLKDSGTGILTKDLLVGCFMAALERYTERRVQGYEYHRDDTVFGVTADHYIQHAIYQRQGFRPASPEQLAAVVRDYYQLAERAQPEMLKFKVDPHQSIDL